MAGLFRQMRAQGRPLTDLELVRRCYDLGTPLHSARFEVDGTPFHTHGIGVASALSPTDVPGAVLGAAVLHNVYTTGDWGDGRTSGPYDSRRAIIRNGVGPDVERLLTRLYDARRAGHFERALADMSDLADEERWLLALDLGDVLDKWADGRIRYSDRGRSDRELVEGSEIEVIDLAGRVGGPEFAARFRAAFEHARDEDIPESLKLGRLYSVVVPPPSLTTRPTVTLQAFARPVVQRVRGMARRFRPADRP